MKKQKGRQVLTVQDLVQTLPKLTHGLLRLISMQKLGKLFRKKINTSSDHKECTPWLKCNKTIMSSCLNKKTEELWNRPVWCQKS